MKTDKLAKPETPETLGLFTWKVLREVLTKMGDNL